MRVRNFYIDAEIDGRSTNLSGGPQGERGGMRLTVNIRDNGESKEAVRIIGKYVDDVLHLEVYGVNGERMSVVTER